MAGIPSAKTIGIAVSLFSQADALWRLPVFYIQPEIVRGMETPLTTFSVPTFLMVWWAMGFTVVTLISAVRTLTRRNL